MEHGVQDLDSTVYNTSNTFVWMYQDGGNLNTFE